MKLLSVSVRNILKIQEADLSTEGHSLFLVGGKNASGKTSSLTAVLLALCGKRDFDWPDLVLRDGENVGTVTLKLSGDPDLHEDVGLTVELTLRRKRTGQVVEEFRILDSTGEEAAEPRTLLKRLYSLRGFDPLSFERSKPTDKAKLLRELLGLDFTELDDDYRDCFQERTLVNRDGVIKAAELAAIVVPDGTPDEALSVSDLFAELEESRSINARIEANENDTTKALVAICQEEAALEAEEEKLRTRMIAIDIRRKEIDSQMDAKQAAVDEAKAAPRIDVAAIAAKATSAGDINRAVEVKRRHYHLSAVLAGLRGRSQQLTDGLKEIEKAKQNRMELAAWPLPGMSLDDSGVMMHGLPFEQASKAQRVLASVRVGMALNPKLRLLICQDGNDLDDETMAALDAALIENDFQMLLEVVTRNAADESRCSVVFRDGKSERPKKVPSSDTVSLVS